MLFIRNMHFYPHLISSMETCNHVTTWRPCKLLNASIQPVRKSPHQLHTLAPWWLESDSAYLSCFVLQAVQSLLVQMEVAVNGHTDQALLEAAARSYLALSSDESAWHGQVNPVMDQLIQSWTTRLRILLDEGLKVSSITELYCRVCVICSFCLPSCYIFIITFIVLCYSVPGKMGHCILKVWTI